MRLHSIATAALLIASLTSIPSLATTSGPVTSFPSVAKVQAVGGPQYQNIFVVGYGPSLNGANFTWTEPCPSASPGVGQINVTGITNGCYVQGTPPFSSGSTTIGHVATFSNATGTSISDGGAVDKVFSATSDVNCTTDTICSSWGSVIVNSVTINGVTGTARYVWQNDRISCALDYIRPTGTSVGQFCRAPVVANSVIGSIKTTPSTLAGLSALTQVQSNSDAYRHVYIAPTAIYDYDTTSTLPCPHDYTTDPSYICPSDAGGTGRWLRGPAINSFGITLTPQQFGAIGDGVADDTAAILAAKAAVGPIGLVYLPEGKTYKVTANVEGNLYGTGKIYENGFRIIVPFKPQVAGFTDSMRANIPRLFNGASAVVVLGDSITNCLESVPGQGDPAKDAWRIITQQITRYYRPGSEPEEGSFVDQSNRTCSGFHLVGQAEATSLATTSSTTVASPDTAGLKVIPVGTGVGFYDAAGQLGHIGVWVARHSGNGTVRIQYRVGTGLWTTLQDCSGSTVGSDDEVVCEATVTPSSGREYAIMSVGADIWITTIFREGVTHTENPYAPLFMKFARGGALAKDFIFGSTLITDSIKRHINRAGIRYNSYNLIIGRLGANDATSTITHQTPYQYAQTLNELFGRFLNPGTAAPATYWGWFGTINFTPGVTMTLPDVYQPDYQNQEQLVTSGWQSPYLNPNYIDYYANGLMLPAPNVHPTPDAAENVTTVQYLDWFSRADFSRELPSVNAKMPIVARISLGASQANATGNSGWVKINYDTVNYDPYSLYNSSVHHFVMPSDTYGRFSLKCVVSFSGLLTASSITDFGIRYNTSGGINGYGVMTFASVNAAVQGAGGGSYTTTFDFDFIKTFPSEEIWVEGLAEGAASNVVGFSGTSLFGNQCTGTFTPMGP